MLPYLAHSILPKKENTDIADCLTISVFSDAFTYVKMSGED